MASDGQRIWVSSVLDGLVLECRTGCHTFAKMPAGLHPFAIAWDSKRKRLWVAADCPPKVPGIEECERGALLSVDLSGRVRSTLAPVEADFHPGDVSASSAGVFVSDSQNGAVYRLSKSGDGLAVLVAPGTGKSAQGSSVSADGKQLIVVDYGQGVTAIDLSTGKRILLPGQDSRPLRGVDGFVRCGGTYYGIYNGGSPGALLSITVHGDSLTYDEPLGDTPLSDPTQVALDGRRLLIVSDSGWADLPAPVRAGGAAVVAVPLKSDCTVDRAAMQGSR